MSKHHKPAHQQTANENKEAAKATTEGVTTATVTTAENEQKTLDVNISEPDHDHQAVKNAATLTASIDEYQKEKAGEEAAENPTDTTSATTPLDSATSASATTEAPAAESSESTEPKTADVDGDGDKESTVSGQTLTTAEMDPARVTTELPADGVPLTIEEQMAVNPHVGDSFETSAKAAASETDKA